MYHEVSIIGAGITGPTAALVLAQAGHRVTVYEQRHAHALHSTGLLGITEKNWHALRKHGVDLSAALPNRNYREVGKTTVPSPFHYIIWTDLHDAITAAARYAGAGFAYGRKVNPDYLPDPMIDAGGVVSAARRGLASRYLGSVLYRGESTYRTSEAFATYKAPGKRVFADIGQGRNDSSRRDASWWVLGVKRPEPAAHHTTFTRVMPPEVAGLPAEFRKVIQATGPIMILPQYVWNPPASIANDAMTRFTLGDANGVVRALTTSGANLGIQAGLLARDLMAGRRDLPPKLLYRRAYALDLGLKLRGPEIGGYLEDPNFEVNQAVLYGSDL